MSLAFQGSSPGLVGDVQILDRISSILQTYFYGVVYAPCIFLSLGNEIEKLRDFVEQLINETNNPNSLIFRNDNKLAAKEVFQLVIRGVNASLNDVEDTLRTAKTHPGQTEKWWMNFAKKIKFNGGDKSFLAALENFKYHTWALGLAFRISKKRSMETLLEIAEQSHMYLDELLDDLLSTTGADSICDAITSKFAEHAESHGRAFVTGFTVETALRISMYWTFKAIDNIKETQISKNLSDEGCLSLFKAYWIFQKFQEDPRAQQMLQEFQAIMVAVSTELSFAAKTILEINVELPPLDTLTNCSDFRILLDDFDDEIEDELPGPGVGQMQLKSQSQDLHPLQTSPSTPQEVFCGVGELEASPIAMSDIAVHPAAYATYDSYSDSLRPSGYQPVSDELNTAAATKNHIGQQPVTLTPPTSPPDPQRRRNTGQLIGRSQTLPSGQGRSLEIGYQDHPHAESNPPGEVLSRSSTAMDSMRYGGSPLGALRHHEPLPHQWLRSPPNKTDEYLPKNLPPLDFSANRPSSTDGLSPLDRSNTTSGLTRAGTISPATPGSPDIHTETSILEPSDYGVRPGETEVNMKDGFRIMNILASKTCDPNGQWDECVVRIFKNDEGDLRILTLMEGSVDQRQIIPREAELVPEYGYRLHESFPVIFIRKAGPGSYSLQPRRSYTLSLGLVERSPASLYYRFKTIMDMFEFQRALLGERVEAEIQVVRTVRYKRGILEGEHASQGCRIQLWKEQSTTASKSPGTSTRATSISGSYRARPNISVLKPRSTRLVMFLGQLLITLFVTDDIIIEEKQRSLRIKPSSHSTFSSRSSVKACVLGNRELTGGIRLDKEGLSIEDEERFDDFRWFDIDFQTPEETTMFKDALREALQDRRKERKEIEDLRRKAASGVRAS